MKLEAVRIGSGVYTLGQPATTNSTTSPLLVLLLISSYAGLVINLISLLGRGEVRR